MIKVVKIKIISELLQGCSDVDLTIEIPEEGELEKEIDYIPIGEPNITEFTEHYNWTTESLRSFPAVRVDDFYMVWVSERKEWIGIKYREGQHHFEGERQGIEEDIEASGPYKLNIECAKLIRQSYRNLDLPLEDVLRTEPSKLMRK